MNVQNFVLELAKVSPSKEHYCNFGFSENMATKLSKSYEFKQPQRSIYESEFLSNDELISLVNEYDSTTVEIGLISFLSKAQDSEAFTYVGRVEIDMLAVRKASYEVVVLDHDDLNWTIWLCAANSNNFLDSLFVFASFLSYKIKNKITADVNQESYECALLCSEKAGGHSILIFIKCF